MSAKQRRSAPGRGYGIGLLVPMLLAAWVLPAVGQSPAPARRVIPVGSQWPGARPGQIDITDDGRHVVFQSNRGEGWRVFIHELGQPTSSEIVGLGDTPYFPHVSPDGRWVMVGKKAMQWKAPLAGGPMVLLSTWNDWNAWETNETIIVARGTRGIWRIRADGSRQEELLAAVDTASGATNYGPPGLLPNGRGVVVSVGFNTGMRLRRIGIVSFPGGRLTLLDDIGINPRWSESGHILYTRDSTLMALPFDVDRLRPLGPAVPVVEGVAVYSNGAAQFDISRTGVLIYVAGSSELDRVWPRTLMWVDRKGNETLFDSPAERYYGTVRLSPNRRLLAAEVGSGLHVFDRQTGTWSVLAESGNAGAPIWSGDSDTLYYSRDGVFGRQPVAADGTWEELWRPVQGEYFWAFSREQESGAFLGTTFVESTRLWKLARLDPGAQRAGPVLGDSAALRRNPALSPDGKWLAYVEKEEGLDHVYVAPYPAGGRPLRVSQGIAGEAAEPIWSRTAEELFYRDGAHMVSVQLETSPALRVRTRTPLFSIRPYYRYLNTWSAVHDYDAATDRFLISRWSIPDDLPGADIQVIENGFDLLNRLAPRR